jgi:uncharacterized protein (TIGR00661 family)
MFFSKSVNNQARKTILTAPLDWGLGHATRCIPIIRELNRAGHTVIIATDGPVKFLLQQEFPDNLFVSLFGYRIKYAKAGSWLPFKLLFQLPQIIFTIIKEHFWLKKIVKQYKVDMIISDNRFGLYHSTVPSVYITHQLFIKTGNHFSERMAQRIHGWFIKKYHECWIPDYEKESSIAGALSHPEIILSNTKYIGCLSRFEKQDDLKTAYQLLILISGPEPQRTIFENKLLQQMKEFKGSVLFVRGLPGNAESLQSITADNILLKNHLSSHELCIAIQQAEMVICRSGYTSIMDLVKLKQKAILIPTPGQPEQEYLADYLLRQNIFYAAAQDTFQLKETLDKAVEFEYKIPDTDMELYKEVVSDFIHRHS